MFPYLLEHARKLETFRKFRYCFLKHKEVCMLPVSLGILKLTSKFPYFLIFHIYAYIYMRGGTGDKGDKADEGGPTPSGVI